MEDSLEKHVVRLHYDFVSLSSLLRFSSHDILYNLHHRRTIFPSFFTNNLDLSLSKVVIQALWHLRIKLQEAIEQSPEIKSLEINDLKHIMDL